MKDTSISETLREFGTGALIALSIILLFGSLICGIGFIITGLSGGNYIWVGIGILLVVIFGGCVRVAKKIADEYD